MAIQRMYTGKGGAVQFDKPAITPTEISQQYGRSMTDILKYKQTMKQRRLENLASMFDIGKIDNIMERDRELAMGAKEEGLGKMGDIYQKHAGTDYDLSLEGMTGIMREKRNIQEKLEAITGGREQYLKEKNILQRSPEDYDIMASKERFEAYDKMVESGQIPKIPGGGFLVDAPVNTAKLIDEVARKVRTLDTDEYTSKDVGDSVVILRGKAYNKKDIETQAKILSGKSRAQKALFDEFGDTEGIAKAIEESLVPLGKEKVAAHKKAEDKTDINYSSKKGITITPGKKYTETAASGDTGDTGDYTIHESWPVERKGRVSEFRVDGNAYVSQASKKATENGLLAGQKVSEGNIDLATGTYEVEKQEIQKRDRYHGDDIKLEVRRKKAHYLGKERKGIGMTKQLIKEGDPVPEHIKELLIKKGMGDRVTVDAVVETVLKSDAYGSFTLIDELGGRFVGELGLPQGFIDQLKNAPLEEIGESGGDSGLFDED